MTGSWQVDPLGAQWRRHPRRAWLVHAPRRPRGRAVRRPRARADDRLAHAHRPAHRRPRARTSSAPEPFDERALPAAAARGRPDARRSATRCSTRRSSPGWARCGAARRAGGREVDPWRPTADVADDEALRAVPRACARSCSGRRRTASRTATSRSTTAPAARARAAGPRSQAARRATTTACCTGVPDARREALRRVGHKGADLIAPGNTPASFDAARGGRRRHDRVRRPARGPPRPGRLAARARPRLHARPAPRRRRSRRASPTWPARPSRKSTSTSTSSCRATRTAWSPRCASAGSSRAHAGLDDGEGQPAAAARAGAGRCGSAGRCPKVKRDYTQSLLWKAPAACAIVYGRAVLPGRAANAIRSGLCDAIMAYYLLRHAAPGRARSRRPAARSTSGPSTTRATSGASPRWAPRASSRTTRACSRRPLADLADRRAVAGRVGAGGRAVPGLGDLARACGPCGPPDHPLEPDGAAQRVRAAVGRRQEGEVLARTR